MANPTPKLDAKKLVVATASKLGVPFTLTETRVRPNDNECRITAISATGKTLQAGGKDISANYRPIAGERTDLGLP